MIYLSNSTDQQEVLIPRSFGGGIPARRPYLTLDDIVNNLVTDDPEKVLSAAMGVELKRLIDDIDPESDIFWAEYGVTTAQEIDQAIADGKLIIGIRNNNQYGYGGKSGNAYYFYLVQNTTIYRLVLNNGVWQTGSFGVESVANRVTEVNENSDNNHYPSAKAVYDALPKDVVQYVEQTLTEAQKEQARQNIGATAPEVFIATYGTTTAAEIDAAVAAGKIVLCVHNERTYILSESNNTFIYFSYVLGVNSWYLRLTRTGDIWAFLTYTLQNGANRVNTISGNETNESKYPSTKAVADALGKMGVVSQKITWSGQQYTLSEITNGLIPQELINQATYWGAVFNTTTGYFEYCGYTDIAADEMRETILTRVSVAANAAYRGWAQFKRIVLPFSAINGAVTEMFMSCGKLIKIPENIGYSIQNLGNNFFNGCGKLKEIWIKVYGGSAGLYVSTTFAGCTSLEWINIQSLSTSLYLANCPAYLLQSIYRHIRDRSGSAAITITLHPDAYARCQADTTEYTYNEQTYTGIIAYATAKNITIQSA